MSRRHREPDSTVESELLADGGQDERLEPEGMSLEALREEYSERADIGFSDPEKQDRKMALWNELRERVDVEQPACPECGEGNWGQAPGEPLQCNACGEYLGENPELRQEIQDAWNEIMGRGGERGGELVTDGGDPEPPDEVRFSPPPEVISVKTRGDEPANPTRVEVKVKYWTHRGSGKPLNSTVTFYTRSEPAKLRDVEGGGRLVDQLTAINTAQDAVTQVPGVEEVRTLVEEFENVVEYIGNCEEADR